MSKKIGNRNGDFLLACIKCGSRRNLSQVAHRNSMNKIVGYIFTCESCQDKVYGGHIHWEDTDATE